MPPSLLPLECREDTEGELVVDIHNTNSTTSCASSRESAPSSACLTQMIHHPPQIRYAANYPLVRSGDNSSSNNRSNSDDSNKANNSNNNKKPSSPMERLLADARFEKRLSARKAPSPPEASSESDSLFDLDDSVVAAPAGTTTASILHLSRMQANAHDISASLSEEAVFLEALYAEDDDDDDDDDGILALPNTATTSPPLLASDMHEQEHNTQEEEQVIRAPTPAPPPRVRIHTNTRDFTPQKQKKHKYKKKQKQKPLLSKAEASAKLEQSLLTDLTSCLVPCHDMILILPEESEPSTITKSQQRSLHAQLERHVHVSPSQQQEEDGDKDGDNSSNRSSSRQRLRRRIGRSRSCSKTRSQKQQKQQQQQSSLSPKRTVRFAKKLVSEVHHHPFYETSQLDELFFAEDELDLLSHDRCCVQGDQIEVMQTIAPTSSTTSADADEDADEENDQYVYALPPQVIVEYKHKAKQHVQLGPGQILLSPSDLSALCE